MENNSLHFQKLLFQCGVMLHNYIIHLSIKCKIFVNLYILVILLLSHAIFQINIIIIRKKGNDNMLFIYS